MLLQGGAVKDLYFSGSKSPASQSVVEDRQVQEESEKTQGTGDEKTVVGEKLPAISKLPEAPSPKTSIETSPPPPLKAPPKEESQVSLLTHSGIILETNSRRQQGGVGLLFESATLNSTASRKANDMCTNQYFAHNSPSGIRVKDLADEVGYDFILIGENLALGDFTDDQELVQAWMNSPGHRANILNSRFTEIGIGVTRCVFEGRLTWLTVQHFGLPSSVCPSPETALKQEIDSNRATLEDLRKVLEIKRAELELPGAEKSPDYEERVAEYNNLAGQYNGLLGETRTLIVEYNNQVALFNQCAVGD